MGTPLRWLTAARRLARIAQHSPQLWALLSLPLALCLTLPLWWAASRAYEQHLLASQRVHVESDLSPYAYALIEDLYERFAILGGLATYLALATPSGGQEASFDLQATQIVASAKGVQRLMVAPGGVRRYVYPPTVSESGLPEDLLGDKRPAVRSDVERAIRSRVITLSDPHELGGDDNGWVAWQAVFKDGQFWGLVSLQFDLSQLLGAVGLAGADDRLQVALRDGAGHLIYGAPAVFASEPVVQQIELPDGHWELAAIPKDGWASSVRLALLVFEGSGLIIVVLLAAVAYLVTSRQARLAASVRERTREISRINAALRDDIARRERAEAEREQLLGQLESKVAERTHHLAALYDVTAVASASLDLATVLERSLDRILAVMGGECGAIHLYDERQGRMWLSAYRGFPSAAAAPEGLAGVLEEPHCWVLSRNEALVVPDTAADSRTARAYAVLGGSAHLSVPICGRCRPMGVICVFREPSKPFSEAETTLLAAIGDQLAVAVENARLYAEARGKAVLEERQRLARELHDSVTQLLYSLTLLSETGRRFAAAGNVERAGQYLQRLGDTSQQALKEMRLLVYELRPMSLQQEGLVGALERRLDSVEKRAGIRAELAIGDLPALSPAAEEGLYRIAEEALNNTLKHAKATEVTVTVAVEGESLALAVRDNGEGFDPSSQPDRGGLGLLNMRERAERLGGWLTICAAPGEGTAVRASVPLAGVVPADAGEMMACSQTEVARA